MARSPRLYVQMPKYNYQNVCQPLLTLYSIHKIHFGVTLRNIILCASTIPLLSLFITSIRLFYTGHPSFQYFCIFTRKPLALRTRNTSMGFLLSPFIGTTSDIFIYFFTLYPFMSHHPSQHSYLDYFAFLGLYSISSPISQSALSVNTIFNTPWFRSLVGRAIFSRKNPTIVRCTTICKLGTYTENITAHE